MDQDILADNVNYLQDNWVISSVEEIDCEQLCRAIITQENGWESNVDSCDFELDTSYFAEQESETGESAVDETVVGAITCAGTKFEYYCEGRRPLGFQDKQAQYFARSAHLEASSVIAFVQLTQQLQRWNAPQSFIERCLSAAVDETRHAQLIFKLAKRYEQEIPRITVHPTVDDVYTVALHNATEGCIFETWAALEAQLKSDLATTEELRVIYAQIAKDELRHSQLSWDLHCWFKTQLSAQQIQQIERAQQEAKASLQASAIAQLQSLPQELGLWKIADPTVIMERFLMRVA